MTRRHALLAWLVKTAAVLLIGLLTAGLPPSPVYAQSPVQGTIMEQRDLDQDGKPELTVIAASFATNNDRILVFDRAGDMQASPEIASAVDFRNDTWIFDVGGNGDAQLIIAFAEDGLARSAQIYDDRDDDGKVAYSISADGVAVTESTHWHVKVLCQGGWQLPDGRANPDLEILVDGYILRYTKWGELFPAADWGLAKVQTDGHVDWRIQVKDLNGDGTADYQLERLQTEIPWYYPVFRTTLYVNKSEDLSQEYNNTIFWPQLVGSHNYEKYNYFSRPPVIAVAWDKAKIDRAGIIGYPTEQGYHINNRVGVWKDGQVNYAEFENPMAFYDLAGDHDGKPELFVRLETFADNDPLFVWGGTLGKFPRPVTQVEYSWDQDNDGKWDYELGFGGFVPITTVSSVGDIRFLSIPYEDLLPWATGQKWEIATFVAAETYSYWNSEGMGEWSIDRGFADGAIVEPSGLRSQYLTGVTDLPPMEDYSSIRTGMRGELSYAYGNQPQMYQSSVDGKLHLMHAQHGVWQVSDTVQLRYSNADGDDYLDRWQLWQEETLERELIDTGQYLLYSDGRQVVLARSPSNPAERILPPPRSKDEWQALEKGRVNQRSRTAPEDLLSLVKLSGGEQTRITGASIRDYRPVEGGFRFVLSLAPGFRGSGPGLVPLSGLGAGDYLVNYDKSEFSIQPLAPPSVTVRLRRFESTGEPFRAFILRQVRLSITNDGLEDAQTVEVSAAFTGSGEDKFTPRPQVITVPAGSTVPLSFHWAPSAPGEWQVRVEATVLDENQQPVSTDRYEQIILVLPAEQATLNQELSAFGAVESWQAAGLLAILALIGGVTAGVLLRPGRVGGEPGGTAHSSSTGDAP